MSDNLRLYTTIVFGLEHVLRQVPSDAWDNPSPCDRWTARQVAGHAIGVVNNVAARAGVGENLDVFGDIGAIAGDDPAESFRPIRTRYLEAMDRPGALQRTVTSSFGEMSLDRFLGLMAADTLIHSWDIARATGVDERLDPDAVRLVYRDLQQRDEAVMRAPGRYVTALEPAGGAAASAQDRLLAFTGRDPRH